MPSLLPVSRRWPDFIVTTWAAASRFEMFASTGTRIAPGNHPPRFPGVNWPGVVDVMNGYLETGDFAAELLLHYHGDCRCRGYAA